MQYPQIAELLPDTDLCCVEGTIPYVLDEISGTNQGTSLHLSFVPFFTEAISAVHFLHGTSRN